MTRLIIARHGKNFLPHQKPRRIGCQTDLPLVEEESARNVGKYILQHKIKPSIIYSAPLKRHMQTTQLIIDEIGETATEITHDFNEIDYGIDDGKYEEEVVKRIGQKAIDNWNEKGILPQGWRANIQEIKDKWCDFANMIDEKHHGENVLLVSSNGIIRFAYNIMDLAEQKDFLQNKNMKISTGGMAIFEKQERWELQKWNVKL